MLRLGKQKVVVVPNHQNTNVIVNIYEVIHHRENAVESGTEIAALIVQRIKRAPADQKLPVQRNNSYACVTQCPVHTLQHMRRPCIS